VSGIVLKELKYFLTPCEIILILQWTMDFGPAMVLEVIMAILKH
jgi:hypothetical protein